MTRIDYIDPEDYHTLIREAAFLAREFLGQQESINFANAGGRNIYVVDSGVLTGYAAAARHGPRAFGGSYGYGELLPSLYPAREETGLTKEERKTLKERRQEESLMAMRVSDLLCRTALGWSHQARNSIEGDLPKDCDYAIFMLPSHISEKDRTARKYEMESGYQAGEETPDQTKARTEAIATQLTTYLKRQNRTGGVINAANLLDKLIHHVMLREASNSIGAADINAKYKRINAIEFDFGSFSGFDTATHQSATEPLDEDEAAAEEFLTWYFGRLLHHKKRRDHQDQSIEGGASESRVNISFENDVNALTQVAMLNYRLLSLNIDRRVVFMTTDRTIVRACYLGFSLFSERFEQLRSEFLRQRRGNMLDTARISRMLSRYFRPDEHPKWFDYFGRHYIRHIHALAHNAIAEKGGKKSLATMFSGLFVNWAEELEDSFEELELMAKGKRVSLPNEFADEYKETIASWSEMTQEALKSGRLERIKTDAKEAHEALYAMLLRGTGVSGNPQLDREHIAYLLNEALEQQRDETMLTLSNLGTNLLIQPGRRSGLSVRDAWIVRSPPDLHFTKLRRTKHMFEQLARTRGYVHLPTNIFEKDMETLKADTCFDEPPQTEAEQRMFESYLKFLVLGAAFAAAEKWSVAHGHASRAVAITKRAAGLGRLTKPLIRITKDGERDVVMFSGREAYFLLAVCGRTLARDPKDIQDALAVLEEGWQIFIKDTKQGETNDAERITLRFAAERVAMALTRFYLHRLKNLPALVSDLAENPKNTSGVELAIKDIQEWGILVKSAYSILDRATLDTLLPNPDAVTMTDVSVSLYIIQLQILNAVMPSEHKAETLEGAWSDPAQLREAVKALETVREDGDLILSGVAKTYLLAGQVLRDRPLAPPEWEIDEEIDRWFKSLKRLAVTTFDEQRFNDLAQFINYTLKTDPISA